MYELILALHIPVALTCIPAYWVPIFAKKGGRLHVLVGRYFVLTMTFVALTGMAMGAIRLIAPEQVKPDAPQDFLERLRASGVFFLYLGIITLVPVLHGWRVVRTRREPTRMRTPLDTGMLGLAIAGSVGVALAALTMPGALVGLFLAMSPIGIFVGLSGLGYLRNPTQYRMSWWYAHMGAMMAGGIAAHTAFAVFVVGRWIAPDLQGLWRILPWIAPTIIGVPLMAVAGKRAMRRFGDA